MANENHDGSLEEQIEHWRSYLRLQPAVPADAVTKLEHQLRAEVAGLTRAGLATDEAFLVAVKRLGRVDPGSREFARERADRVWKQLIVAEAGALAGVALYNYVRGEHRGRRTICGGSGEGAPRALHCGARGRPLQPSPEKSSI